MSHQPISPVPHDPEPRSIDPSALGRFVSLDGCPQWFQFRTDAQYRRKRQAEHDYKEAFEPLNVLLAKDGHDFERSVVDALADEVADHIAYEKRSVENWTASKPILHEQFDAARDLDIDSEPILLTQPKVGDRIGAWDVSGDADLVLCWPLAPDHPENDGDQVGVHLRVLDIKAAHEEKTYQQIQVACYTLLLEQFLEANVEYPFLIEGGIVIRPALEDLEAADSLEPDAFPQFDLADREVDVRRLLQPGGQLDELGESDPEDVRYQLAPKCQGCAYREACYTEALETRSIAQLGLSANEQRALAEEGISTIEDLAGLGEVPEDPRAYQYEAIRPAPGKRDIYQRLLNDAGLGGELQRAIQQAQTVIGEIEGNQVLAANSPAPVGLYGSGNGTLPDDDPYSDLRQPIERKSMIRVYLNIQQDHRYDRINAVGGYVSTSRPKAGGAVPIRFGHLAPDVPDSMTHADSLESVVLDRAIESVFDAIETIGAAMDTNRTPVHFYVYTRGEYDALVDGLTRQDSIEAGALCDLLGLRGAIGAVQPERDDEDRDETEQGSISAWDTTEAEDTDNRLRDAVYDQDQAMISVVQNDVRNRHALGMPSAGLLQVLDKSRADEDALHRSTGWSYTRESGQQIDLREAFRENVFDYFVPYTHTDEVGGIDLHPGADSEDGSRAENEPDGFYPSRPRSGAELPLEYVWAAHDVLTAEWVQKGATDLGNYDATGLIAPFRWIDPDARDERITTEDIEAIVETFAHACAHVERAIKYKSREVRKRPLGLGSLSEFELGESSTARAAAEFLALEYDTGRQEQYSTYGQPIDERIRGGNTVPFVVEESWVDADDRTLHAKGTIPYQFWFDDTETVARACRLKGGDGTTMGSWLVANRLTHTGEPRDDDRPFRIEKGTGVAIEELDLEAQEVHITASYGSGDGPFLDYHKGWTTDPAEESENRYLFAPGEPFVLDKRTDDIVAQRSFDLLSEARNNTLCTLIDRLADGAVTAPTTEAFDTGAIREYIDWAQSSDRLAYPPNANQAAFISEDGAQLTLLQGPPGTGKTSGAAAHATLARVCGLDRSDSERGLRGLVAGESNKAVDEVLEDVHDLLVAYREDEHSLYDLADLELVRLASDVPDDALEQVTYLDYNSDDDGLARIVDRLRGQGPERTLVFATPARLYKLVDEFSASVSAEERLAGNESYFDLLTVDEASMMRLPSFLTAGAFLHSDAQVLVAGDQRQMAPVRKHEWDTEQRRIIRERVPYLSALDYCRLLGGEAVDDRYGVDEQCAIAGTGDLPFYQLEESYRCHTDVATFLSRQVYEADGIDYRSSRTATVCDPDPVSEGVAQVLGGQARATDGGPTATPHEPTDLPAESAEWRGQATFDQWEQDSVSTGSAGANTENGPGRSVVEADGDSPGSDGADHALTLIVHDECESRQSNAVEAAIGAALDRSIQGDDTLGIVTPHNAQRGLVNTHIESVECETVERYQGGERPVIMVSATASDPDFVRTESDFLLDPNRLTVAMSRMQRGLIVVASRTVFDVIPTDVDEYERAGIWKGLYDELDVLGSDPTWSGNLAAFVGSEVDLNILGVTGDQRAVRLAVHRCEID
jgi:hypothetical protein